MNPLYWKLAITSLRRNYRTSVPFLGGSILMIAMIYSLSSIANNPELADSYGGPAVGLVLGFGLRVIEIFTLIFFFYLISVWNRVRQQESGLLSILGMEKRHLAYIFIDQMILCLLISVIAGVLFGIVLDKLMFLLILKLSHLPPVLGFHFSLPAFEEAGLWALVCYGAISIWSIFDLIRKNPLDLYKSRQKGEQKIKNRWILALLGLISLGIGYTMAIVIKNPVDAVLLFFVAVLFVMAGTYLLFMFGMTTLLEILKKKKSYYYKTNHFISTSLMRYRLKQNAASLANITILSSMILVTLSTTVSLMAGLSQAVTEVYAREYKVTLYYSQESPVNLQNTTPDQVQQQIIDSAVQLGLKPSDAVAYRMDIGSYDNSNLHLPDPFKTGQADIIRVAAEDLQLPGISSLGPNEAIGFGEYFQKGQVLNPPQGSADHTTNIIQVQNKPEFVTAPYIGSALPGAIAIPASELADPQAGVPSQYMVIQFNTPKNQATYANSQSLHQALEKQGLPVQDVRSATEETTEGFQFYGHLLFIGIYISALFILAVVLIMYYKQISEGLEDRQRFKILQNTGLESRQIRKIINDQVLFLFFIPLATAAVHVAFAFPMISRVLNVMSFGQSWLFLGVTASCVLIFSLIYVLIYRLTTRTYYRLTSQDLA